jgi:hypothetical protein
MDGGRVPQALLERRGQVVVGGLRADEGRRPQHLAIPARHPHRIEDVEEADGRVVRHVGVPVLPGIGEADGPAVLDDVRENPDLGHLRLVIAGEHRLDAAKAPREVAQGGGLQALRGKAQDAKATEGAQDGGEVAVAQGVREIDSPDRGPQDLSARLDRGHVSFSSGAPSRYPTTQPYQRWLGRRPSSRYAIFIRLR